MTRVLCSTPSHIKHELALYIRNHTPEHVLTVELQRMSLADIAVRYKELLAKSPYRIYRDCASDWCIFVGDKQGANTNGH